MIFMCLGVHHYLTFENINELLDYYIVNYIVKWRGLMKELMNQWGGAVWSDGAYWQGGEESDTTGGKGA